MKAELDSKENPNTEADAPPTAAEEVDTKQYNPSIDRDPDPKDGSGSHRKGGGDGQVPDTEPH